MTHKEYKEMLKCNKSHRDLMGDLYFKNLYMKQLKEEKACPTPVELPVDKPKPKCKYSEEDLIYAQALIMIAANFYLYWNVPWYIAAVVSIFSGSFFWFENVFDSKEEDKYI